MKKASKLEQKTVLFFSDKDEQVEVVYEGLLSLENGTVISVTGDSNLFENQRISRGKYIVNSSSLHNQLTLTEGDTEADSLYRYYKLTRLQ